MTASSIFPTQKHSMKKALFRNSCKTFTTRNIMYSKQQNLQTIFKKETKNLEYNESMDAPVLFFGERGVRTVELNRPRALNALNLDMVRLMEDRYLEWNHDRSVKTVILKGRQDPEKKRPKALCAGGDVVAIHKNRDLTFFEDEYNLDYLIGTLRIPQVAIMDGIVMGGGVGISVHNRFRIATENSMFAMPESQIGFFADVGGSHFLPRLKGGIGYWLGLTGARIKGEQLLACGVATNFCPSEKIPKIENLLVRLSTDNHLDIQEVIFSTHPYKKSQATLENRDLIDEIFNPVNNPTVEDIISSLEKDGSEFSQQQLKLLSKASPTSLKVIYRQLQEGAKLNLKQCFEMELGIAKRMLAEDSDFYEGVRAQLIDKDFKPKWKYSSLDQVTDEYVEEFFSKVPIPEDILYGVEEDPKAKL